MFYTYAHYRKDTGAVFYIGKGSKERAHSRSGRNAWWRRIESKAGRTVKLLAAWSTEADALEHEKFLMACFRDIGADLCNLSEGGGGSPGYRHTTAARVRIGVASSARRRSAETRQKMSAAMKGVHTGRVLTAEHRAAIAAGVRRASRA